MAYSPDGRLLAGPYEGNQVGLWESDIYRLVGTLTGHEGTVLSVAFNADGRHSQCIQSEQEPRFRLRPIQGPEIAPSMTIVGYVGTRIKFGHQDETRGIAPS